MKVKYAWFLTLLSPSNRGRSLSSRSQGSFLSLSQDPRLLCPFHAQILSNTLQPEWRPEWLQHGVTWFGLRYWSPISTSLCWQSAITCSTLRCSKGLLSRSKNVKVASTCPGFRGKLRNTKMNMRVHHSSQVSQPMEVIQGQAKVRLSTSAQQHCTIQHHACKRFNKG